MKAPKTIKVSETMIMPHGRNNVTHVYHSDTALREWIEENTMRNFREINVVSVDELLKLIDQ